MPFVDDSPDTLTMHDSWRARRLVRMTALLISINKQNKLKEAGLKVTGI